MLDYMQDSQTGNHYLGKKQAKIGDFVIDIQPDFQMNNRKSASIVHLHDGSKMKIEIKGIIYKMYKGLLQVKRNEK